MSEKSYVAPRLEKYGSMVSLTREIGEGCIDVPMGTPSGGNVDGDCS